MDDLKAAGLLSWNLPADFIEVQRKCEQVARDAGFHIPDYESKKANWRKAILDLKGVLDRYDIPFPAGPYPGYDPHRSRPGRHCRAGS